MFLSKKALAIIAVLVLLIAVVGAGFAQGNEITACVMKNGQVRFLTEDNPECKSNEKPLTWNIEGIQGDQGIQGEKGDKGDKGDTGDTGPQGIQGIQGDQGIQGEKGDKGDKGDTGDTGDKGDKGDTGAQGPKGDTGDQGVPGYFSDCRWVYGPGTDLVDHASLRVRTSCQTGETAVSGGWGYGVWMTNSLCVPISNHSVLTAPSYNIYDTWEVTWNGDDCIDNNIQVYTTVFCCK